MKRNKPNSKFRSEKALKLLAKIAVIVIIISLATSVILGYIWKVLKSSDFFRVNEILIREGNTVDLSYLKGRNIFSLNLDRESRYILEFLPDFQKVKIIRVLPNRLFVDFVKRNPVALVKLYKYFSIDSSGVIFNAAAQAADGGLPIIAGLETKILGPKPGVKYSSKDVLLALNIIKEAKDSRVLKNYKISRIDIANPRSISLFIPLVKVTAQRPQNFSQKQPDALEIKIGQEDIKETIGIISGLLEQERNNLMNIRYIDLRFKEPVIKLKNAK